MVTFYKKDVYILAVFNFKDGADILLELAELSD